LLEVAPDNIAALTKILGGVAHAIIGQFNNTGLLVVGREKISVDVLRSAWKGAGDNW
jgi:hypothetical protein